jgi:hypothetical protein
MSGERRLSDAFGLPGEGVHKYRIGGLAAVDLLATGGAAFLVSRFALGRHDLAACAVVFIILVIAAIAIHEAFGVNTRLNAAVFGRTWRPGGLKDAPNRRAK